MYQNILKNKYFRFIIKLTISIGGIYIVASKINIGSTVQLISNIKIPFLILSVFLFIVSKVNSSERLYHYLISISANVTRITNLKLYVLGMFYNLFLPGGIGGDGYKIYFLRKHNKEIGIKKITTALLVDRLSGFLVLLIIIGIVLPFLTIPYPYPIVVSTLLVFLLMVVFYAMHYIFISRKSSFIGFSFLNSIGVQGTQLLCVYFLMLSLNSTENQLELLFVFLLSTITAMLPISIGGIGLRELTFYMLSGYFSYSVSQSVSLALLFFIISSVVSFGGLFYALNPSKINRK